MSRDPLGDPRAAEVLRLAEEDAARRQADLAAQTSHLSTPEDRIRIWERRHQLQMPRNPEHRLIDVIAQGTALSRAEVLQEQRLRADKRLAVPAA